MNARIRVPVAELEEKWMSPEARGLANNLQLGVRIVTMADGTQYEAPLADVSAALAADEAEEKRLERLLAGHDPTDVVEGRVLCDATAAHCRCHKDAGHVEAGDPVHACDEKLCTGQWSGSYDDASTFRVLAFPRSPE